MKDTKKMKTMNKTIKILHSKTILLSGLLLFILASCWAPRCPDKTCRVRMEHIHDDKVSGIFMGRNQILPPRIHYLWDKDKGEKNPDTKTLPNNGGGDRQSRKLRKKFPWEKW